MKKLLGINILSLTTLLTIITAVVPHHHHEGLVCVVMEECEQDKSVNDRHTAHHDDGDPSEEEQCSVHKMGFGLLVQKDSTAYSQHSLQQTTPVCALCANTLYLDIPFCLSALSIDNVERRLPEPFKDRIKSRAPPRC